VQESQQYDTPLGDTTIEDCVSNVQSPCNKMFTYLPWRPVMTEIKLQMMCYGLINPLTLELNPSAQRCLTRFFTGDFAS
jgi:hypothetical protein